MCMARQSQALKTYIGKHSNGLREMQMTGTEESVILASSGGETGWPKLIEAVFMAFPGENGYFY